MTESLAVREVGTEHRETVVLLHGGNVAGWMWGVQVEALAGEFHVLVPDLPGFGDSNHLPWSSIADAAAQVRALVADGAHGGAAHVVGLSLGALVALEMLADDVAAGAPVARSAVVSSALVVPSSAITRRLAHLQLRFWERQWYWRATARAFGIPAEDREVFVRTGLGIAVETERAVVDEVVAGRDLAPLAGVRAPVLVVAGGRDSRRIRSESLAALAAAIPGARTAVAPGGHHHWNAEKPDLFSAMVREWVRDGRVAGGLAPSGGTEYKSDDGVCT